MDKVFYFKVGDKDVRVGWPTDGISQALTVVFAVLLVVDIFAGNMFGAFVMALFLGLNTVRIK